MAIETMWAERYRPRRVADCILPKGIAKFGKGIVKTGAIPSMTFSGGTGVGKTTLALALADELGYEWLKLNGSGEDRGIDTVKGKITRFATTMSIDGSRKVIVVDEADNMTPDAQLALRSVIEDVSSNCAFILTCNYASKLDAALLSRCSETKFIVPAAEREELQAKMFYRAVGILKKEEVEHDQEAVAIIVTMFYPDFRNTVNELQRFAIQGGVTAEAVRAANIGDVPALIRMVKAKDFAGCVKWIAETPTQPQAVFDHVSTKGKDIFFDDAQWANACVIAGQYQFQAAFVADQRINLQAFCAKLMGCSFR